MGVFLGKAPTMDVATRRVHNWVMVALDMHCGDWGGEVEAHVVVVVVVVSVVVGCGVWVWISLFCASSQWEWY